MSTHTEYGEKPTVHEIAALNEANRLRAINAELLAALIALSNSCDTGKRGLTESTKAPSPIELLAARATIAKGNSMTRNELKKAAKEAEADQHARLLDASRTMLIALRACVADHEMLLGRINEQLHIDGQTAVYLLQYSTDQARAAIAKATS